MSVEGVNPDCEQCGGSGFIMLWDYDGPGLHDEDNCPCIDDECRCDSCEERRAAPTTQEENE